MQKSFKGIGFWLAILIVFFFAYTLISSFSQNSDKVVYSDLVQAIKEERVSNMLVNGTTATVKMQKSDGTVVNGAKVQIPSLDVLQQDAGVEIEDQMMRGVLKQEAQAARISWLSVMNILLTVVFILVLWFGIMGKGGGRGNTFTKSRAKLNVEDTKVKFSDVAGAKEEKAELEELVEFLKNPHKFISLGARIPKGVLLVGSPGTGKTLLAKAIAGEAGVPFFSISGSDFVELYVGVGASRVRDLFEQAKKNRPCIIFIDEIDAVGRKRGAGMGGGHDEREQTLNQLLVEMDGFGANEGVIMIAATNRPDILDPALLRPGRFDRQVVVDLPDVRGREEILKVHSKKKPLADEVNLAKIAKATAGYTGADLENLMNEAAIFAARREHLEINNRDLEDANIKVMMGAEKRSKIITEAEKQLTAYHEAGHALLSRLVDPTSVIHQVSIIPRGRAGGYTMYLPEEDKMYASKKEMLNQIVVLLGGRVAEALVLDDISTGASSDIQRASSIARQMVVRYGMSERIGPVSYDDGEEVVLGRDYGHSKTYSERTASEIDEEVKVIIDSQYENAHNLLEENRTVLEKIAKKLLVEETIDQIQFEQCFEEKKQTQA